MPTGAAPPAALLAGADIADRLAEARAATDALFAALRPQALRERPVPERHRLIFYLGHLEAFDWNLLSRDAPGLVPFRPDFDRLFAFGIDPTHGGLPDDPPEAWPAADEVRAYVADVRERIDRLLRDEGADAAPRLDLAIEHRLMHAETLAWLVRELPQAHKVAPKHAPPRDGTPPEPRSARIPAGVATLGRPRGAPGFGWDNEFEECALHVPAFEIDVHDVTNARFLRFIEAGGYGEPSWWTRDGWDWIRAQSRRHPAPWRPVRGGWRLRAMWEEIDLPLAWPVQVSHAEASAYARWAGRALPSEAQFHRAAYGTPDSDERRFPWGDAPPDARHGRFGLREWDFAPAGSHPAGASAFGLHDLVGNGWEWTSTPLAPLPGFEALAAYPGYSQPFFDGDHFVLKGGGPRTADVLLRRSFRNWFQPRYAHVAATFRTVAP
ncbi:MAG TPA: SUMF1/EgtB/PvdO family nonheme iron enzyme [Planctomycetota bacterium]|nr:SUMF1/EgtB/PvdO family nonheme iron enzyme [Planctomycetota bacterium]